MNNNVLCFYAVLQKIKKNKKKIVVNPKKIIFIKKLNC